MEDTVKPLHGKEINLKSCILIILTRIVQPRLEYEARFTSVVTKALQELCMFGLMVINRQDPSSSFSSIVTTARCCNLFCWLERWLGVLLLRPPAPAAAAISLSVSLSRCNVYNVANVVNSCWPITSRRQMAGSPPNLHTMDSKSACIHGVLKVKVKGHVIWALLCWQENRFFSKANDRIKASSLQSNISSISVTFARWKHHCGRSLLSTIALFISLHFSTSCNGRLVAGGSASDGRRCTLLAVFLVLTCFYTRQHVWYSAYMPRQFHLSVRLSVTRVLCVKAAECIIEILSLSDRHIILVFCHQGSLSKSDGFTPNGGAKYKGVAIFDQ